MTLADRWLLPDGVDESLPAQAERIEHLRRTLLNLHHSWGYQLVIPPLLEYLDSLLTGAGSDLENETFKVIDQLSGRMMGIRADFTSQVARIDAHCLKGDAIQRLSYCGSVLRTVPSGLDGTRSPIQIGAELYGHGGVESDVEIVSLMIETLSASGINAPVLDLGHVDIVCDLMSSCDLSDSQRDIISGLYKTKDLPELEVFVASLELPENQSNWLNALPRLCGDESVISRAHKLIGGVSESTDAALKQLQWVKDTISLRFPNVQFHFDLSDLVSYNYHTGLVFAAYLPGQGNAIARGGRYNNIGEVFGRSRLATGFSADLKTLVLLSDFNLPESKVVLAPASDDASLWEVISKLRSEGFKVVQALNGATLALNADFELVCVNGDWQTVSVDL
ncbi:ATP phosphoribosyltransferase regulatory subunit [Marinomonas sp. 2405UD68-3]|uniref:ATP phosphoribosyltransferase regulatory subunit n=1 Tax=Marinomonas sp. 2405UD68-3 TaxID=3391835 RepID=UPI0039C9A4BF